MLDVFFADDSKQDNPSRDGMGPLVAVGAIYVPGDKVKSLEDNLEEICKQYGFPSDPVKGEFKWSPGRKLWMHDNLTGKDRENFFLEAINQLKECESKVTIVIADKNAKYANPNANNSFEDVTFMLLERIETQLNYVENTGIIVTDRPSGGRSDEDKFLQSCLETITSGTKFVKPQRIAVNVLSSPSKLIRCLQIADVITSASLAFISGEDQYSPKIFAAIKPLLNSKDGRIGGIGIKIHPDYKYRNLYYWLLGDNDYYDYNKANKIQLPESDRAYENSPLNP